MEPTNVFGGRWCGAAGPTGGGQRRIASHSVHHHHHYHHHSIGFISPRMSHAAHPKHVLVQHKRPLSDAAAYGLLHRRLPSVVEDARLGRPINQQSSKMQKWMLLGVD